MGDLGREVSVAAPAGTPATGRRRPRGRGRHEGRIALLFISPWIVGFLVFMAYPVIYTAYLSLTDKEREVFAAVARGLSNTEIAGLVFASESTVKTHVGSVLRKLSLRDRVQIVVFAHEHGLVGAD